MEKNDRIYIPLSRIRTCYLYLDGWLELNLRHPRESLICRVSQAVDWEKKESLTIEKTQYYEKQSEPF